MAELERAPASSIFLSYASEDRAIALTIAQALRAGGFAVWFDQDELKGGDAWDQEIRERIRTCTFFVPLITAATEARAEGYFRREWKLAIERSHDMADDRPFLVPVLLATSAAPPSRVPERFREVQWHRLVAGTPVEPLVERLQRLEQRLQAPPRQGRGGPTAAPWTEARPARRSRWILAGLALLLAGAGGGTWYALQRQRAAADAADRQTVAVLPFENFGGDAANEYFSDGLTEELLTTLARETTLRVVPRTSCFAFKGRQLSIRQIGAELRAGTLVEGSVRRLGDRFRVSVRLVNAVDGYLLWTEVFEPTMTNLFEVQTALALTIAAKLQPGRTAGRTPALPGTKVFDAYDAFLRGRSYQLKAPTRENVDQAIGLFQQATRLDPNYAVAWAHYGEALIRRHNAGFDDAEETLRQAREAIATAFKLAADLPQAHRALASFYTVNWTNIALAEKELLLAEKGLPNDSDILADLAVNHLDRGNREQAVAYIRRAAAADLQNGDIADLAALIYDYASLYPEAVAERDRAFKLGGATSSIVDQAVAYRNWKGDLALALQTLERVRPDDRTDADSVGLYWRVRAAFLQAKGDYAPALAAAERMPAELYPTQFYYNSRSFVQARICEAMGDAAGARLAYERALVDAERYRKESPRKVRAHTLLALIYAGLGRSDEAWAAAQQCLQLAPATESRYVAARASLRVVAQVAARTGRTDEALAIVRSQIESGFWKRNDLLLDNDWRTLRADPRFLALARAAPL